jgi:hypothetical protein
MWRKITLFAVTGGVVLAGLAHPWMLAIVAGLIILFFGLNALFPQKPRDITPQQWAMELERHLLGDEGAHDWDATTSEALADKRLTTLQSRLADFDRLDTPEKTERFREIIAALKRGEIPTYAE